MFPGYPMGWVVKTMLAGVSARSVSLTTGTLFVERVVLAGAAGN